MRQIFQSVVVISLTIGAPCIIFGQGGSASVRETVSLIPTASGSRIPYTSSSFRVGRCMRFFSGGYLRADHSMTDCTIFPSAFTVVGGLAPQVQLQAGSERNTTIVRGRSAKPAGNNGCMKVLTIWMADMTPEQQAQARYILEESFPRLRAIKIRLREKMRELQTLTYAQETDPQALPALGQELQQLRRQLGQEFDTMNCRLKKAVGRPLPLPPGRGFRSISDAVPE